MLPCFLVGLACALLAKGKCARCDCKCMFAKVWMLCSGSEGLERIVRSRMLGIEEEEECERCGVVAIAGEGDM